LRILLVGLNSRYVHTNLALRCLREALKEEGQADWNISIREFSINEQIDNIAAEIYEEKPDLIGFSCYIWNITQVLALSKQLRLVMPQTYILVGGPEVSYDGENLLSYNPQIDAVIIGEGECSVPSLIKAMSSERLLWEVSGVVWRLRKGVQMVRQEIVPPEFKGEILSYQEDFIVSNRSTTLPDINKLPNPYAVEEDLNGRLAYIETTRGCPYNCKFCISSTFTGVRFLEPERFRETIKKLFQYGAGTIKFVDRTFNANKKHGFEILKIFKEEAERYSEEESPKDLSMEVKQKAPFYPRAHCEMAGELLDEDWIQFLRDYPSDMIQLEIGVQSTHQPTLEAISRPQSFATWKEKVRYLQHTCNIPIHLDLIAGLPYEGWSEFTRSFNEVYEVKPDNLQLGFLKVLKGSEIWKKSEEFGLVYSPDPPYTVLETKELSHGDILALKKIEEVLGKYYNSGRFKYILEYVLSNYNSAFDFYHAFSEYWQSQNWFRREWNRRDLFSNLWEYLSRSVGLMSNRLNGSLASEPRERLTSVWKEALRFDFLMNERPGQIPEFLISDYTSNNIIPADKILEISDRIRKDPIWQEIIPESKLMDRRQWARATAVERFGFEVPKYCSRRLLEDSPINEQGAWYLFYYTGKEVKFFIYPEQKN